MENAAQYKDLMSGYAAYVDSAELAPVATAEAPASGWLCNWFRCRRTGWCGGGASGGY